MTKGIFRKLAVGFATLAALAGCNPATDTGGGQFLDTVFSNYFVQSYSPADEAAANTLRNSPAYNVQYWTWTDANGVSSWVNSLIDSGIEYAHAVGLTGAGQTIAIVDNGFRMTHEQLAGKTIWTSTGYAPGSAEHGTHVATIAAGNGTSGAMIGAAPSANLMLSDWTLGWNAMIQGNRDAISVGAVVQNNSWGLVNVDVTASNYQSEFGSGVGATWLSTMDTLAQNAIVVFALDNDTSRSHAGLYPGLPKIRPSLEKSWIAVVNARPTYSGTSIASATRVSSKCFEAAAWCITANGQNLGGTNTGDAAYAWGNGTSYAAPLVSGAIALLAQAFPGMSAQQLRARLLASADNSFFSHTGYVQFSPSVRHGYNSEFGHGFMSVKAALLPIGGSYVPLSGGGTLDISSPVVASGGMSGDALAHGLAQRSLSLTDGMGAGFDRPASLLTAQAVRRFDPLGSIADLFAVDLQNDVTDPFAKVSVFSDVANGQEMHFGNNDAQVALLIPAVGAPEETFGVSASRVIDAGAGQLRLGLSALREFDSFAGMKALSDGANVSGTHAAATFDWRLPMAQNAALRLSGAIGVAVPDHGVADMRFSSVNYNSINLSYGARDIWGNGDSLSLAVGLPQAVQSGSARVALPVAMADGSTAFDPLDVSLAPEERQIDLTFAYGVPLGQGAQLVMSALRSLNAGNIAGSNTTEATLGLRFDF